MLPNRALQWVKDLGVSMSAPRKITEQITAMTKKGGRQTLAGYSEFLRKRKIKLCLFYSRSSTRILLPVVVTGYNWINKEDGEFPKVIHAENYWNA